MLFDEKWSSISFSWLLLILSTSSFLIILFATVGLIDFGVISGAVMWFWLTRKPKKGTRKMVWKINDYLD